MHTMSFQQLCNSILLSLVTVTLNFILIDLMASVITDGNSVAGENLTLTCHTEKGRKCDWGSTSSVDRTWWCTKLIMNTDELVVVGVSIKYGAMISPFFSSFPYTLQIEDNNIHVNVTSYLTGRHSVSVTSDSYYCSIIAEINRHPIGRLRTGIS